MALTHLIENSLKRVSRGWFQMGFKTDRLPSTQLNTRYASNIQTQDLGCFVFRHRLHNTLNPFNLHLHVSSQRENYRKHCFSLFFSWLFQFCCKIRSGTGFTRNSKGWWRNKNNWWYLWVSQILALMKPVMLLFDQCTIAVYRQLISLYKLDQNQLDLGKSSIHSKDFSPN